MVYRPLGVGMEAHQASNDAPLTNATTLTVESTSDGVTVDRWTKYGNDRLYVDGIAKADKYSLHVDLQANEVVSDNESAHTGSVEVEGDTATVTIVSHVGLGSAEYTLTLSLEGEEFEAEDDEDTDDEEESEDDDTELVTDGGVEVDDSEAPQPSDADAPTAKEFIPADENGIRSDEPAEVRYLQATAGGGLEELSADPYDDTVENHVLICDECGAEEFNESDMAFHLNTAHNGGDA